MEDRDAKARRAVRTNNFTQQTNALDVDKHMYFSFSNHPLVCTRCLLPHNLSRMAYIEENMKLRRVQNSSPDSEAAPMPLDPQEELYRLSEKYKIEKKVQPNEEGSVTNSLAMLTAIPEVDLGMEYVPSTTIIICGAVLIRWWPCSTRLKNIEETEKAKQALTQARKDRQKRQNDDEEHLSAARCTFYTLTPTDDQLTHNQHYIVFRPNTRMKSDADIIRDAKLEAIGLPPAEDHEPHRGNRPRHDRPQMATDEMVRIFGCSSFSLGFISFHIFIGYGAVQEADAKVVACVPAFPSDPGLVLLRVSHLSLPASYFVLSVVCIVTIIPLS